jgi:hypothetical protein
LDAGPRPRRPARLEAPRGACPRWEAPGLTLRAPSASGATVRPSERAEATRAAVAPPRH